MKKNTRTQQLIEVERQIYQEKLRRSPSLLPFYERKARELIHPDSPTIIQHGEIVPSPQADDYSPAMHEIKNTLLNPDTPASDASLRRTDLLHNAGALEVGIDAANTIQAQNSIEKMLVHEMSACHIKAMELMGETVNLSHSRDHSEIELQLKKIAVAAKLMDVFQKGMDTLSRTRNGGRQTITVKQVHVSGGQNVIADRVQTGGTIEGGK